MTGGMDGRRDDALLRIDWYPGDYLSDPKVRAMTLAQRGAYVDLLNFQARLRRGEKLSASRTDLARMLGCVRQADFTRDIWPGIRGCFRMRRVHLDQWMERDGRPLRSRRWRAKGV